MSEATDQTLSGVSETLLIPLCYRESVAEFEVGVVVGQMEAAFSLTGAANLTNLLPLHYSAWLHRKFSGEAAARVRCDLLSGLPWPTSLLGDSINLALAGTGGRTRMLSIFQSQSSSLPGVRS